MASQWKYRAKTILQDTSADLGGLSDALAQARSLNPRPHNLADSLLFDWMEALRWDNGSSRSLQALRLLFDAGVDPQQGHLAPRTSPEHKKNAELHRQFVGLVHGTRGGREASRLKKSVPLLDGPAAFETNWVAKVMWAARDHKDLVPMVELCLDRGVHPHDQGPRKFLEGEAVVFPPPEPAQAASKAQKGRDTRPHCWSCWPVALGVARMDLLEVLAQRAGPSRPPDWVPAVWAALRIGLGRPNRMPAIFRALSWFLDRYPPTPADHEAMMDLMVRGKEILSPQALAIWLSLPQSVLHHPKSQSALPEWFNPWACLGGVGINLQEPNSRLSKILARHPQWGNAQSVREAPWHRQGDARRDLKIGKCSILASWLMDSAHEGPSGEASDGLFEQLAEIDGLVDPALPRAFLCMRGPPGPKATRWLKEHPEAWLSDHTPWHHGPSARIQAWLEEMGISPFAPDKRGVQGVAAGLVEHIKGWEVQALQSFVSSVRPLLGDTRFDWSQEIEGFSVAQWAYASSPTHQLSPLKGWDAGAFVAAMYLGDRERIDALFKEWEQAGSPDFSMEEGCRLLEAWATGSARFSIPPRNSYWMEEDARERQETFGQVKQVLGPRMLKRLAPLKKSWIWARQRSLHGTDLFDVGNRGDLGDLWQAHEEAGVPLTSRDRWALAAWAFDAVRARAEGDTGDLLGPTSHPLWESLPEVQKAWVARATLEHMENNSKTPCERWHSAFAQEFAQVEDLTLGASKKRTAKVLHQIEALGKVSAPPLPIWEKWSARAHAAQMHGNLPSPGHAPARPRMARF